MRNPPLSVIHSWPTPNYVDPETRAGPVLVLVSICIPVMTLIVALRLYTRMRITKCFGLDDWMIIPSFITGFGYCVVALVGTKYGWYNHIWDVPIPKLIGARKLVVVSALLGLHNVAFTKMSVLLLYRRLFPPSRTLTIVNILLLVIVGWMVSMTITNFLLCIPLQAYWDISFTGPQICVYEVPYFVSFSCIDLFLDTVVYILPMHILVKLRMPIRQKIILVGIFGLGTLAIGAAALRLPSFVRASESYDMTWELGSSTIWTVVEACVGITCASAPALKPLVERYVPVLVGTLKSSNTGTGSDDDTKVTEIFRSKAEQDGWNSQP